MTDEDEGRRGKARIKDGEEGRRRRSMMADEDGLETKSEIIGKSAQIEFRHEQMS